MILFLDIDGVLHPETEGRSVTKAEAFCCLPKLEAVLREYPLVHVVITSEWRCHRTLDQLREHFSEDIRPRVIGVTSVIGDNGTYIPGRREREIRQWLADNGRNDATWLAIDDKPWLFVNGEQVICCRSYRGFDEEAAQLLRAKLGVDGLGL